jgi:AcrR family transcriptional regulator
MTTERTLQRERAILDAAFHCFERYGVHRTRMEDVADEAGISRALLYRYFPNRAELVEAVSVDRIQTLTAGLLEQIAGFGDPEEAIVEGMMLMLTAGRSARELFEFSDSPSAKFPEMIARHAELIHRLSFEAWHPVVEVARSQGRLRPDFDEEAFSDWMSSLSFAFVLRREFTEDQIRHLLRSFAVPGIIAPAGPPPRRPKATSRPARAR